MIERTRGVEEQLRIACEEIRQLRDSLTEAQEAANQDPLTGLPNRRALDTRLAAATESARESGRPFAIAICDIDHFKAFNDRFGHQIGDEVIKFVATSLAEDGGERLFAARYGGEEFVVLFEGVTAKQAGVEIDRIRAAIGARDLKINATGQTLGRLTFSAGVSELGVDDDGSSAMLKRADVSLYEAKRKGRNQVVIAA
jgi:diguanylate cyclase